MLPEIGIRLGRPPGELEREQELRLAVLNGLVRESVVDVPSVRSAIAGHRRSGSAGPAVH